MTKRPRINTPEEFERFCVMLFNAKTCTTWTHWAPMVLWDHMRGMLAELPESGAYNRPGCPNGEVDVTEEEVSIFRAHVQRGDWLGAIGAFTRGKEIAAAMVRMDAP